MAKYKMKPKTVEAISFNELIEYGITQTDNIYNNMPWSFKYAGIPITHETDECYIIGGFMRLRKNQVLIIDDINLSVVDKDEFNSICEPMEE